jgi:hypothetical protein
VKLIAFCWKMPLIRAIDDPLPEMSGIEMHASTSANDWPIFSPTIAASTPVEGGPFVGRLNSEVAFFFDHAVGKKVHGFHFL